MKILNAAAVGALLLPSAAAAEDAGMASFNLVANVPVSCWVQPQAGPILAARNASGAGQVVEACNSSRGYQVTASYRALNGTEHARLRYGDRSIQLPAQGQALLRQSTTAQIRSVSYVFDDLQLDAPLVLALSIQPL